MTVERVYPPAGRQGGVLIESTVDCQHRLPTRAFRGG
jgi:hypothetical protein